jgi:RNase P protein component
MNALFSEGRRGSVGALRFCWVVSSAGFVAETERFRPQEGGQENGEAWENGEARESGEALSSAPPQTPTLTAEAPVSVLFSVPKKSFKKAWKRNLIKRRMRESYRTRKHALTAAAAAAGQHIDIALICSPTAAKGATAKGITAKGAAVANPIPDFKTLDNAIEKILAKIHAKILERS